MARLNDRRLVAGLVSIGMLVTMTCANGLKADDARGEDVFAAWTVIPESELSAYRGGDISIMNDGDQTVTVTGNAATNVTGGDISISGNAFGNLSGFQGIAINTGNNAAVSLRYTVNFIITL